MDGSGPAEASDARLAWCECAALTSGTRAPTALLAADVIEVVVQRWDRPALLGDGTHRKIGDALSPSRLTSGGSFGTRPTPVPRDPPVIHVQANSLERSVAPRAGDGKRNAGTLDIHEQPAAVRTVGRAGELAAAEVAGKSVAAVRGAKVHVVLGEPEDVPVDGQTMEEFRARAVLTQDEPAARACTDIVGRVEDLGGRRLEDRLSVSLRSSQI